MASLVLSGDTSGSITVSAPAVAGSTTQTLVNVTGTLAPIVSGTAVTASGTSVDFTGIPSWAKRITVLGQGVSSNGTSAFVLRTGSGSIVTTGYSLTQTFFAAASSSTTNSTNSSGLDLSPGAVAAAGTYNFKASLELLGSNIYVATIFGGRTDGTAGFQEVGAITLSGALDRVRVTAVNGTDTFDAGTINILYE